MEDKLDLAVKSIFNALTVSWEDNGNIMADAVRDNVISNLSVITGMSLREIEDKIDSMGEEMQ